MKDENRNVSENKKDMKALEKDEGFLRRQEEFEKLNERNMTIPTGGMGKIDSGSVQKIMVVILVFLAIFLCFEAVDWDSENRELKRKCTACVIAKYVDSDLRERNGHKQELYKDYIYQYEYDGKEYTAVFKRTANEYTAYNSGKSPLTSELSIYVDPNDPQTYYLPVEVKDKFFIAPFVFVFLAIAGLILFVRKLDK